MDTFRSRPCLYEPRLSVSLGTRGVVDSGLIVTGKRVFSPSPLEVCVYQ